MADDYNAQVPKIIVIGFQRKYRKQLVKNPDIPGDPGTMQLVEDDWVTYAPAHSPINSRTSDRIKSIDPAFFEENEGRDGAGRKLELMRYRWSLIEPAYEAWKAGREIPVNGTPLAIWPGIMPEVADVLRGAAIRTVEQVRDMTEKQMEQVRLPNMRELKKSAGIFLENSGSAAAAEREAQKDAQIAAMMELLEEQRQRLDQIEGGHDGGADGEATTGAGGSGGRKRGPYKPRQPKVEQQAA